MVRLAGRLNIIGKEKIITNNQWLVIDVILYKDSEETEDSEDSEE